MDYQKLASDIIKQIGGKENVEQLEHCSTRLRFTLADNAKANRKEIEQLDGVMGVADKVQYQIIIGNDVSEVYQAIKKQLKGSLNQNQAVKKPNQKKKLGNVVLEFIIGVFQPLIPAIAGGGILKSLLLLLNLLGVLDKSTQTYQILYLIGDAPLYFLPLLVAYTAAIKLNANPLVAVAAVGALLLPNMSTLITEGATLFSFPIKPISYAYQVFPAILCVLAFSQIEKFFNKISPKMIRSFFVPLMSLTIVVPLTLLILGPIGFTLGQWFVTVILFIFGKFGWVAVALLAMVLPFMVVTGMHKAMIPYVVSSLGQTGKELIYNAASLAHNLSEAGACFAVALRSKDKRTKSTALSAGISALFGITEPALYGITIQNKRVLYGVMIGSFIGGSFLGIMGVEAYVAVGPGLASLSMFISEELPKNIMYAIFGLIIAFVASFISVSILFKDLTIEEDVNLPADIQIKEFKSPIIGKSVPLAEVQDAIFSKKIMGDGVGFIPQTGELYAPVDGSIVMVFDTKHSIGMKTTNGVELLFHVGIDTVNLKGQFFETHVAVGDEVQAGDLLMTFDLEKIIESGFDPTTVCILTNSANHELQNVDYGEIDNQKNVFELKEMGA